jgi:hypothetical protein
LYTHILPTLSCLTHPCCSAAVFSSATSSSPPVRAQHIDGINLFGLISIASLLYCIPAALYVERGMWAGAWQTAVANLGSGPFYQLLAMSGLFYHLYNQVCASPASSAKLGKSAKSKMLL